MKFNADALMSSVFIFILYGIYNAIFGGIFLQYADLLDNYAPTAWIAVLLTLVTPSIIVAGIIFSIIGVTTNAKPSKYDKTSISKSDKQHKKGNN